MKEFNESLQSNLNKNDEKTYSIGHKLLVKTFSKSNDELFQIAFTIRKEVFIEEQKFDIKNEIDYINDKAMHYIFYEKTINEMKEETYIPIGTARSYSNKIIKKEFTEINSNNNLDCFNIGRVALLKEYRKKGYGKVLMEFIVKYIKETNSEKVKFIKLSSQDQALEFYKKVGFIVEGESYYDEHVLHYDMKMEI